MARMAIKHVDELEPTIGKELVVSDWYEVPQLQIDTFAEATDDRQWIHVDVERAKRDSPFGGPIAHGFLTMSLLSLFLNEALEIGGTRMGVNYGFNRLRFTAPVRAGSRLRGRFGVKNLRRIEGGVQIIWDVTVECEGQAKPALVAEWVTCRYG